jgi:prophage regulatory protein
MIGASRSWPWKLARDGRFPQPIKLSARCTRWRLSDVRAWMADPLAWQAEHTEA